MGICHVEQGAQLSAPWKPSGVGWGGRWEVSSEGKGHMHTCGLFMLMYGRNRHNIVKQLSSNKPTLKFCRKPYN